MKIILVGYDFRTEALAGSFRVRKLALSWQSEGHQLIIISAHIDKEFLEEFRNNDNIILIPDCDYKKITLSHKIWRRMIGLPDPSVIWANHVIKNNRVQQAIKESNILFISSPPHGIQKIGVWAKKNFNISYLADLRDDFLTNHRINWRTPIHKYIARQLEKKMVAIADKVILNTPEVEERFKKRYSYTNKFISISNGYDKNDFSNIKTIKNNPKKDGRLVYVGSPYNGFAPEILEKIAGKLEILNNWQLHIAGPGNWNKLKNNKNCIVYGLLSHQEASDLMSTADILLLFMPPGEREPSGTIPLKTYSYLASERFIIYFGEQGATSRVLSEFDGTAVFSRDDIKNIDKWLLNNANQIKKTGNFQRTSLEKYEMSQISKKIQIIMQNTFNEKENRY